MNQPNDLDACRNLLNEIAELCDHASLTGSLSSGAKRTAVRYNSILQRLEQSGDVPASLFGELPEDADFGEIGVEARMLASYFSQSRRERNKRDGGRDHGDPNILIRLAPFVRQEELGMLVREQRLKGSPLDMNTLTGLAPFLGQDVLSDLLREHLMQSERPTPPVPPVPPTSPATQPAHRPEPAAVANTPSMTLESVEAVSDNLDDVLNLLRSQYLTDEERDALVEKARKLSS